MSLNARVNDENLGADDSLIDSPLNVSARYQHRSHTKPVLGESHSANVIVTTPTSAKPDKAPVRPIITPSKADELENLFSQLSLKTPAVARASVDVPSSDSKKAPLTFPTIAPESDNDEFEDCISSLPSSPKLKTKSSVVLEEEDDDSEIVFNNKPHETSVSSETKDATLAEILPEDLENDSVSISDTKLGQDEQISLTTPVEEQLTVDTEKLPEQVPTESAIEVEPGVDLAEVTNDNTSVPVSSEKVEENTKTVVTDEVEAEKEEVIDTADVTGPIPSGVTPLIETQPGLSEAVQSLVESTVSQASIEVLQEPVSEQIERSAEPEHKEPIAAVIREIVVEEPTPDVVEPTTDAVEPTPDVVEPTPDVVEPTPDVVEPTPTVVEHTPDVVEPTPDVVEPKSDIVSPTPDIEPTTDVVEPMPDIVESTPETPVALSEQMQEPEKEITKGEVEIVKEGDKAGITEPTEEIGAVPVQMDFTNTDAVDLTSSEQVTAEAQLNTMVTEPIKSDEPMEVSSPAQLETVEENITIAPAQGMGLEDPVQIDEPRVEPQINAGTPAPAEAPQNSVSDIGNLQEELQAPSPDYVDPPSGAQNLSASPPILPKGTYKFDFDNFDENSDPFAATTKVGSSPPPSKSAQSEAAVDPFKPITAIVNSPATAKPDSKGEEDTLKHSTGTASSPTSSIPTETADPFKPNKAMANSPLAKPSGDADPFKATKTIMNSPPQIKSETSEEIDPFKPTIAMANSPVQIKSEINEDIDPFKPSKAMANSPVQIKSEVSEDIDPFKAKTTIPNSPIQTKPEMNEDLDPFKPGKAMPNSPPQSKPSGVEDMDPFKPSKTMANSPPPKTTSSEDVDPFQPTKAMANSPPPAKPSAMEDLDPFKSRSSIANSPPQSTQAMIEDLDPFKPTKQMANSPPQSKPSVNEDDIDPFKPKKSIANSPVGPKKSDDGEVNDENVAPKDSVKKSAQKKPTTKATAGPKRPRFKPPPHFAKKSEGDDDDIQIFVPGPKAATPAKPAAMAPPATAEGPAGDTALPAGPGTFRAPSPPPPASEGLPPATDGLLSASDGLPLATDGLPPAGGALDDMDTYDPSQEEFVSATDFLNDSASWDFLNKCGTSDQMKASELTRQSLYVKFDPLVKGTANPAKPQPLNETATWDLLNQYGQDEAKKPGRESLYVRFDPLLKSGHSPAVPRAVARLKPNTHTPTKSDDLMMMTTPPHTPAVPVAEKPANKDIFSFSPAKVPATPLSEPAPCPDVPAGTDNIIQVIKYSESDVQRMLREVELDQQAKQLSRERAWAAERDELLGEKAGLVRRVEQVKQNQEQLEVVIQEYEMNLEQAIRDLTLSRQATTDMTAERDQALEDLKMVESAFSDLHRRYEKVKSSVEGFKKNEEQLKKCVSDMHASLKKKEHNYAQLKQKAEEKLEALGTELKKSQGDSKSESTRLQATIRKSELQIKSLEQQLEQKTNENKELTAICDELLTAKASS